MINMFCSSTSSMIWCDKHNAEATDYLLLNNMTLNEFAASRIECREISI